MPYIDLWPAFYALSVLELTLPTMHLHFWDLGGSPSVRTLWSKYYDESDAVVWVVDARHFVEFHNQGRDIKGKGKAPAHDTKTEASDAREASWKLLCKFIAKFIAMFHPHPEEHHANSQSSFCIFQLPRWDS